MSGFLSKNTGHVRDNILNKEAWVDMGLFEKTRFIMWCRLPEKDEHLNPTAPQYPTT